MPALAALRTIAGTNNPSDWICPVASAPDSDKVAYVTRTISNYIFSLQASANYRKLQKCIEVLTKFEETGDEKRQERLSSLRYNRTKFQATKLIAILSDIKPAGDFETSDAALADQAQVLSKLYKAIWTHPNTKVRQTLIRLFQFVVTGEGYLRTTWESDPFRGRDSSLNFEAFSIDDIAFSQLPSDKDIQKAYCTVIRHEYPLATACMLYPEHSGYFNPNNQTPTWLRAVKTATSKLFQSEALNVAYEESMSMSGFPHSQSPPTSESTIDIYECYVMDFSINKSGKRMQMGERGTSEYYEVPFIGEEIPTCLDDLTTRKPLTRKAHARDCLIYPNRRRIVCTNSHILSDGPSPWAHGQTPLVRFTLNDWVWDRVGDPVALEGERLNWTIEMLYKGFHDMVERQIRPGMNLPNTLSHTTRESYDPRVPGKHLATDPFTNQSISPTVPYQHNVIQASSLEFVEKLKEESDYVRGEPEIRALSQAQQVPSAETFKKFLQLAGPMTTFVALNIEGSFMEVGEQVKGLLMQYCTAARRYHLLGKKGLVKEDFNPDDLGNMVPSTEKRTLYSDAIFPSTLNERVRLFQRYFTYRILPGSAYQLTDVQRQMMILQAWRDPKNLPISPWLVSETLGCDIGPIPDECKTRFEEWEWFQKKLAEIGISIQAQGQISMAQVQLAIQQAMQEQQAAQLGQGLGMLGELGGGEGIGMGDLSARPPGRPPSGNSPPSMQTQSDGRTIVSESD